MLTTQQTPAFAKWFSSLSDRKAQAAIARRIVRLEGGLFGDTKSLGDGVSELRIDFGPGYRLSFTRRGATVIVLLCGGDKGSQSRDIAAAKALAQAV